MIAAAVLLFALAVAAECVVSERAMRRLRVVHSTFVHVLVKTLGVVAVIGFARTLPVGYAVTGLVTLTALCVGVALCVTCAQFAPWRYGIVESDEGA